MLTGTRVGLQSLGNSAFSEENRLAEPAKKRYGRICALLGALKRWRHRLRNFVCTTLIMRVQTCSRGRTHASVNVAENASVGAMVRACVRACSSLNASVCVRACLAKGALHSCVRP
eukprot:6180095-Pleurochrysis_carterae.AAC.2